MKRFKLLIKKESRWYLTLKMAYLLKSCFMSYPFIKIHGAVIVIIIMINLKLCLKKRN
jgi:uncharacterized membrane protein YhdT